MTKRLERLQRDECGALSCCSLQMLVRVLKTMRFRLKHEPFMDELAKTSCGNELSFHSLCLKLKGNRGDEGGGLCR